MKTPPISSLYNRHADKAGGFERQGFFRTGRIIDAITLTSSRDGHVMLRIGNREVDALTSIVLPKNRRLSFKVLQVAPQVVLKFVPPAESKPGRYPLRNAMLTLLPRQSGLAPLLTALATAVGLEDGSDTTHVLRPLVNSFINTLPRRQNLMQAEGVRQAIMQSGLFLEAMLAGAENRNAIEIPTDLKALLLRLLQRLAKISPERGTNGRVLNGAKLHQQDTELPPPDRQQPCSQPRIVLNASASGAGSTPDIAALYNKAQGALARLILHQIISAENADEGQHIWRLELPVLQHDEVDIVSIAIKHEDADNEQDETRSWVIDLAVDLPRLGPISIRTGLCKQGISSTFWCNAPRTRSLIESRLNRLKSRLDELGMITLNLRCHQGTPPAPAGNVASIALVDQHV